MKTLVEGKQVRGTEIQTRFNYYPYKTTVEATTEQQKQP
jgi:hypothetical protein